MPADNLTSMHSGRRGGRTLGYLECFPRTPDRHQNLGGADGERQMFLAAMALAASVRHDCSVGQRNLIAFAKRLSRFVG